MKHGQPWASGPGEILRHALSLLQDDSDVNRRLAMICIDNAVELMIKTYLGLPKRVTGLSIPRKEYQEATESFPALLDALEKYAADRIQGIDLGVIEWYHRLRNELYHEGNGLTVERDKVEVYAELAELLFKKLFGFSLARDVMPDTALLGQFMEAWAALEQGLLSTATRLHLLGETPRTVVAAARFIRGAGLLTDAQVVEIEALMRIRNEVVHGVSDYRQVITPAIVERVRELARLFPGDE